MTYNNNETKRAYVVIPELLKVITNPKLANTFCYHTFNHFANHLINIFNDENTLLTAEFNVVKNIEKPLSDEWIKYGLYKYKDNKIYFERRIFGNTLQLMYEDNGSIFNIICNKKYYNLIRFTLGGGLFPPGLILQNIVTTKLLERGYAPLHCACVSKNGRAALLPAPPDTGKSTTMMLAMKRNYNFISEEVAVVDSNLNVFSCPLTTSYAKYLKSYKNKLHSFLAEKIPIFPFYTKQPLSEIVNFLRNIKIDKKSKIGYIILLERGETKIEETDKDSILHKILAMNRAEFPYYHDPLLNAYSYFKSNFDLYKIVNNERKILEKVVEITDCYVVKSKNPKEYINLIDRIFML